MKLSFLTFCCLVGIAASITCPAGYFPIDSIYLCVGSQENAGNGYYHNQNMCRAVNRKSGDLAAPYNAFRNAAFAKISLQKSGDAKAMIGVKRDDPSDENSPYLYPNGIPLTYSNWTASEPAKGTDCVAIDSSGLWYGVSCNSKIPYLCQFTVQA
ncbi:unnamed protein product, partial [Mesorhabditis spiculigera]